MRKFLAGLFLVLALGAVTMAQNSITATVQVTDAGSQAWVNGTWTVNFVGPASVSWPGGTVVRSQTGSLSATGGASVTLANNNTINPSPTFWVFTVCPNSAVTAGPSGCFTTSSISVTTVAQSITITPPAIVISVPTTPTQINPVAAYADAEISGGWVGFQYFQVNATPSSSVNRVCQVMTGSSCTTWANSGGGVGLTTVTSLPATCTPGTTSPVVLNLPSPAGGIYTCVATNIWNPDNPSQGISPLAYGAKWDGKFITDAASTSNQSTYTCPNSDCGFTSADLGKLALFTSSPSSATPACVGAGCGTVLAQGFICTINSASSIVIGSTFPGCSAVLAASTCATSANGNCNLAWATQDDSTAINNAAAAAWNNGNTCMALELPSGVAFFSNPIMNVTVGQGSPCAGNGHIGNGPGFADFSQTGPTVYGRGAGSTILIPYNFNLAGCTFGASGHNCLMSTPSLVAHDFQITGLGQSGNGTTNNVNLVTMGGVSPACTATTMYNMALNWWLSASTGTVGLNFPGGCFLSNLSNTVVEEFGTQLAVLGGQIVNLTGNEFFGFGGAGGSTCIDVSMQATTAVVSTANAFANANGACGTDEVVNMTGTTSGWNSFGDTVQVNGSSTPANGIAVYCAGGTCDETFTGTTVTIGAPSSGSSTTFECVGGGVCNIKAYSSKLLAAGSAGRLFVNSGAAAFNYYDACGNTVTNGGAANVGTINIFGSCSITGTTITAAKLVLSTGWGTTAAWSALSGSTQQVFGTITASGTGQAANPTITYTFPTPFLQTPTGCFALQVGGTQPAVANPFTPSALSATGVTLTYNGTPVAGDTLVVQIQCWNP